MENKTASSFDHAAQKYDLVFTHSEIGKLQRARVYYWLNQLHFFDTPKDVFEINCGTGYDAELFTQKGHTVIATDLSNKMVEYAKKERSKSICFYTFDAKEILNNKDFKNSEALFSNFGGLNCLSPKELANLIAETGNIQKKGDQLIFVIMAKKCLMENLYFLLTVQWKKLGRRNTSDPIEVNVDGNTVATYYHSPEWLVQLLEKKYIIQLKKPIAAFLPPSYLEPFFARNKWLLNLLYQLEKTFSSFSKLAKWSDHYILVAKRKEA